MIHVFVGTKAQFIKTAPIMKELDHRGIRYNFIDAGQHAELTAQLIRQFGLRDPDVRLTAARGNINTVGQAARWVTKSFEEIVFRCGKTYRRIFSGERGICLIHGDTLTTLISLMYAKRCGVKVAHIEAGLRSYSLLDPFPEELIRLIAMRYSDLLFAPSDWAFENLRQMGYAAKTVHTGGNTVAEAVRYARNSRPTQQRARPPYVVASAHRLETIYSRARLARIVSLLARIADERLVLFVVHEPTRRQLRRFGLDQPLLHHESIEILPVQPYFEFINLLADADFVVTDGGSIQEEAYFLNVPCLILRTRTERREGLNGNALLAGFDERIIDRFLRIFASLRRAETNRDAHPSRAIVDRLLDWI